VLVCVLRIRLVARSLIPFYCPLQISYAYLRHPSYIGFYYWAIGTQILLNNLLHTFLFAAASTFFFRKRIPFEEESLLQYFPDEYPAYRARTWIGIPFVPTVEFATVSTTHAAESKDTKDD
jgi:Isoprenylcysteine carboxyl methyltransferase (ICMT) family